MHSLIRAALSLGGALICAIAITMLVLTLPLIHSVFGGNAPASFSLTAMFIFFFLLLLAVLMFVYCVGFLDAMRDVGYWLRRKRDKRLG